MDRPTQDGERGRPASFIRYLCASRRLTALGEWLDSKGC